MDAAAFPALAALLPPKKLPINGTFANCPPKSLKGARASLVAIPPTLAASPITVRIIKLNPIFIAAIAPTANKTFLITLSFICSSFSLFPEAYALRVSIP